MKIIVFSKQESILRSNKRIASGWPINNLEKKLYGTMDKLIAAFIPSEDIAHIEKFIDLSQERVPANLEITITTKYRR